MGLVAILSGSFDEHKNNTTDNSIKTVATDPSQLSDIYYQRANQELSNLLSHQKTVVPKVIMAQGVYLYQALVEIPAEDGDSDSFWLPMRMNNGIIMDTTYSFDVYLLGIYYSKTLKTPQIIVEQQKEDTHFFSPSHQIYYVKLYLPENGSGLRATSMNQGKSGTQYNAVLYPAAN